MTGKSSVAPGAIRAVLFDLDGTLADTAPDLAGALDRLAAELGLPAVPRERTRSYTSSGARGLLQAGLGIGPDHAQYEDLRQRFLDLYAEHVCVETTLFPGMAELLTELEERHLTWGVVTNKAARFTQPLLTALGLGARTACTVSGDTTDHSKPHPEPLLHAARQLSLAPKSCLYVGDDLRDVQAARAAGMPVIAAAFGYLGDGDPDDWGADAVIAHPKQVLDFL